MKLDALLDPLRGIPQLAGARCVGRHEMFDPRDAYDPDRDDIESRALQVCRRCPALPDCSAWFDSLPATQRPVGVVAGRVNR